MSDEQKKTAPEQKELIPGQEGNEEYRFLDQKIKRRPMNRKLWLTRILGVIGAGIIVGLIASLVFGLMHPELRSGNGANEENAAKITIPADEEPEETPEPTEIPTPTETPAPTETPEEAPAAEQEEGEAGTSEEAEIPDEAESPEETTR